MAKAWKQVVSTCWKYPGNGFIFSFLAGVVLLLPSFCVRRMETHSTPSMPWDTATLTQVFHSFVENYTAFQLTGRTYYTHVECVQRHLHHLPCHAAWLWPYSESIRKCARSWSSVVALMEDYPHSTFACSQVRF